MICTGASKIDSKNISSGIKQFSCPAGNYSKLYDDFIAAGILGEKIDNFRRISLQSKQTIFSVALALHDADITLTQDRSNIGLIASSQDCCHQENLTYFQDYVEHGRSLGRGNLFVNTLPTTPGAVAGIACNLHGLLYFFASNTNDRISPALAEADLLLGSGALSHVVVLLGDDRQVASFVFKPGKISSEAIPDASSISTFFDSICNMHKKT